MFFLNSKFQRLKRQSAPDQAFKAALRARLLDNQPTAVLQPLSFMRYAMVSAVVALVVVLGTSTYAYASPAVAEGTPLYSLKTGIENIEGSLKQSPEARARFKAKITQRRIKEVVHRLQHHQVPPRELMTNVAHELSLTMTDMHELAQSPEGRTVVRTEIKIKVLDMLNNLKAHIENSALPQEQKDEYQQAITSRIEKIETFEQTTP